MWVCARTGMYVHVCACMHGYLCACVRVCRCWRNRAIVLAGVTPHLALDLGLSFGIRYEVKTRQRQLPLPLSPPAALLLSLHLPSSLPSTRMTSLLLPSSMTAFQPQEAMCQPVDHHRRGDTSWLMKRESASGVFRTDDN